MVEVFDRTFRFVSYFHKDGISAKIKGLYSLNKLGAIIGESSASIIGWKFLVMVSTKCNEWPACIKLVLIYLTLSANFAEIFIDRCKSLIMALRL